jgi:hypothetical protein
MTEIYSKDLKVGDIVKDLPEGENYAITFKVLQKDDNLLKMTVLAGDASVYHPGPDNLYDFPIQGGSSPWYQY